MTRNLDRQTIEKGAWGGDCRTEFGFDHDFDFEPRANVRIG